MAAKSAIILVLFFLNLIISLNRQIGQYKFQRVLLPIGIFLCLGSLIIMATNSEPTNMPP